MLEYADISKTFTFMYRQLQVQQNSIIYSLVTVSWFYACFMLAGILYVLVK